MKLMSKQSYGEGCNEQSDSGQRWLHLAFSGSGKGDRSHSLREVLEPHLGSKGNRAAIGMRGVSSSNASARSNIETFDLALMDTSAFSTGSSGGPRPRSEFLGFNGKGPFSVVGDYIRPSDRELINGICDDNAFVAKKNLWPNQEDVNADKSAQSNQDANDFGASTGLVEVRPGKESPEQYSKAGKEQVGARAVDLFVIHSTILSQFITITADSIKAVR
jgi:hypothetical protein